MAGTDGGALSYAAAAITQRTGRPVAAHGAVIEKGVVVIGPAEGLDWSPIMTAGSIVAVAIFIILFANARKRASTGE